VRKIVIGTDHHGFNIKQYLMNLKNIGKHEILWIDVGANSDERVDYPLYAQRAVKVLQKQAADVGILLCGTGVGMSMAANRFKGMFAALSWNQEIARRSKEEDGANILVLPADYLDNTQAVLIIQAWLDAEFLGGHYQKRLEQLDSFSNF